MTKELDAIAIHLTGVLGYEVVMQDLQDPQQLTMTMYVALKRYAQTMEVPGAAGPGSQQDFDATFAETNRLLYESPWTIHPDYGVMRSAALSALERDNANLQIIARNVDRMDAGVPVEEVADIVNTDIAAFRKIGEPALQRHAAEEITNSIDGHTAYKQEFMRASTRHPGLVEQFAALNAVTKSLVDAKEARKSTEYAAIHADKDLHSALENLLQMTLPVKEAVTAGLHIGRIVAMDAQMAGQQIGRDPDTVVWHDLDKLTGPRPRLGESAEIYYADGKGTVKDPQQERSSNGIGR